jgi:hypothetical protein
VTAEDRDRELSRLFEVERLADESAASPLDAVLGRPSRRRAGAAGALHRLALAAAVALVIAASAVVLRSGASHAPGPGAPDTTQLAEWKSPTAFLLDTPGSELLTEVPSLTTLSTGSLASTEPGDAAAPQPTKGAVP